jgi:anoctamin-10
MNYAATFMNCIVIARANNSQLQNLIGEGSFTRDIAILVATEHVILLIKYILEIAIPDVPAWVERELKRYEFYEKKQIE